MNKNENNSGNLSSANDISNKKTSECVENTIQVEKF